jgi:NitT/TauT family transport system substrate-binding protein
MARPLALAALAASALVAAACRKAPEDGGPFRLAFFPNLTHAQALVGTAEGAFEKELGGAIATRQFNAGPAAMEALLAGDVDVAYVGPGPAAIAYLRSKGAAICVVAGAVSGGAGLVARSARTPRDLLGKRVASPQLGNTQDIALRVWLRGQGLTEGDGADKVKVLPLSNPDILGLFRRGEIEAAWVPEPWGARLRAEAGGHVIVDERALWPGGRFPTTIVVASRRALEARRAGVVAVLRAHAALTERWRGDRPGFARAANAAFGRITGHPLPEPVLQDAFAQLEPLIEPMAAQIVEAARHAQELGYAPRGSLDGLADDGPLAEARAAPPPGSRRARTP